MNRFRLTLIDRIRFIFLAFNQGEATIMIRIRFIEGALVEQKNSKIQIYLDEQTSKKIKSMAKDRSMSISKYAARVLENHTKSGMENELFQVKIQAILAQILGSVYDYELVNTNAEEVKTLLQKIEDRAKEKVAEELDQK